MNIEKIHLDKDNRMLRIGFGKHNGVWFFRIDLWRVAYRFKARKENDKQVQFTFESQPEIGSKGLYVNTPIISPNEEFQKIGGCAFPCHPYKVNNEGCSCYRSYHDRKP